jgi:hypothetical protein
MPPADDTHIAASEKESSKGAESLAQRVSAFQKSQVEIAQRRKSVVAKGRVEPIEYLTREVVIDRNGAPRQAGTDAQEGQFIERLRETAEKNLYFFLKAILNRHFLTNKLHKPVCEFQQKIPPFRKLTLMPREHAKTAIVSGGLPLHIIIQPADGNCYFPGLEGSECRILLMGETQDMAEKNLRVLQSISEENQLFRALWPHRCWDNPKKQAKVWNQRALIFPRANEWPDPTIWAKGADGAVTGSRPNCQIKDDLISLEASRSSTVMDKAIEAHKASRALMDSYETESGLQSLEWIIGTRWAVYDLYSEIIDNDYTVELIDPKFHRIINNGEILWPEKHTEQSIKELMDYHKHMFYLLYLNSADDPTLTDFNLDDARDFKFINDNILFESTEADDFLDKKFDEHHTMLESSGKVDHRGRIMRYLTPNNLNALLNRHEYLRLKRH